jgi:hypothetical protein
MPTPPVPDNLRFALELFEAAEELLRRRLQRMGGLSNEQIEARVDDWIAENGERSSVEHSAELHALRRA